MREDIVGTGARHVDEVREINRDLIEKSLHMRCLAYLSQVKAQLLTETIFEVDSSKKQYMQLNTRLAERNELIRGQRHELEGRVEELLRIRGALEESNRALEEKNRELERFNKLFVDRELRVAELKQRIRELEETVARLGGTSS